MIDKLVRPSAPFYIQLELTEKCNNKCYFCYNPLGRLAGNELTTDEIKDILNQLNHLGIFRINFNGGEPLTRPDIKELIKYGADLGFDLHMNTNSTLVNDDIAEFVSKYMTSICTSILNSKEDLHDRMTGRKGAYKDVIRGIKIWRKHGVKVEINVCTSTDNYTDIYDIGKLASELDCYALCVTRYILNNKENNFRLLTPEQTLKVIEQLHKVKADFSNVYDVTLPGPVSYCELPDEYKEDLKELNIPCQYGYGLARISPTGKVTPCPISNDEIGDLRKNTFEEIWKATGWDKYVSLSHLPIGCKECDDVSRCRGGCVGYDESIRACGIDIKTKKWRGHK